MPKKDVLHELGVRKAGEDIGIKRVRMQPQKKKSGLHKAISVAASIGKAVGTAGKQYSEYYWKEYKKGGKKHGKEPEPIFKM